MKKLVSMLMLGALLAVPALAWAGVVGGGGEACCCPLCCSGG